jgi:hypothetical protein
MNNNLKTLENDLRTYFASDKGYDGSVTAANARERNFYAVLGSLPYGIKQQKFLSYLYMQTTTDIETSVSNCIEWVERELDTIPKAPNIF